MNNDQAIWTSVDVYFNSLLITPDHALDAALTDCVEADIPLQNLAPNQGQLIALLIRMPQSKTVLEIGTQGD